MTTAVAGEGAPQQPPRIPRPNYGRIHSRPLPVEIFPLPTLLPHNPLSILRIAYVYLSHFLRPPTSHTRPQVEGWFHAESNSVHVTHAGHVRLLWEPGFFGKGSLSRSEPTWLDREKKRLGLIAHDTSEEYTRQRREERRRMKAERAKKEREAIEETLQREETDALDQDSTLNPQSAPVAKEDIAPESSTDGVTRSNSVIHETVESSETQKDGLDEPIEVDRQAKGTGQTLPMETSEPIAVELEDLEHLQLCPEEAFFLIYALGILEVLNPETQLSIPTVQLLSLFRSHSYFPPQTPVDLTPYDPFLLSYVTYHHFRSLGWVVRPGIKFAVDWLLYLRGPAFAHAEFAVVILPAFRDRYWWENGREESTRRHEKKDWWWFHCLQRVQAQVRKGLVICWVEIPRPDQVPSSLPLLEEIKASEEKELAGDDQRGVANLLKKYKVREMIVKRWLPNRSRD